MSRPRRWPRWVTVAVASAARRRWADPAGLLVTLVVQVIVVVTLSAMWRAGAQANGGSIAGYTAVALTWYIATSEASTISLTPRMIEEIGRDIGSGAVAVELLRPAPPLGVRIATELGQALPRLATCVVAGTAVSVVVAGAPSRPATLVLAAPSLVLAVLCNIVTQHAFAAAAFWIRDAGATWFLYQKLVFVLGGMLIPLEVLPRWLQLGAAALPFRAMAYAPARLAAGYAEPLLLVQQLAWLAVMFLVAGLVFQAGTRRLQVVGG